MGKRKRPATQLSERRQRFVEAYLLDTNATQAAIKAGYSVGSSRGVGYRLLKTPDIQAAIAERRERAARRADLTLDAVIAELKLLAFANMADYIKMGPYGHPVLDFSGLTRDQAAALVEVAVSGPKKNPHVRFRLADKHAALVDLGRHLGGFANRTEVTGKDGAPLVQPVIHITIGGASVSNGHAGNGHAGDNARIIDAQPEPAS